MNWDNERADRYLASQALYDDAFELFDAALLKAADPRPGRTVLDVGCGFGSTLVKFAEAIGPAGHAVGMDIAEPMVRAAKQTIAGAGLSNARVMCGDAQVAAPEGAPFDIVMSRLGLMFFQNLPIAFENLRSMTARGGTLAFVCWQTFDDGPWVMPHRVVAEHLDGEFDRSSYADPYRLADRGFVEQLLINAGYSQVEIEPLHTALRFSDAGAAFDHLSQKSLIAEMLLQVEESERKSAIADLRNALESVATDAGVELAASAWLVKAKA